MTSTLRTAFPLAALLVVAIPPASSLAEASPVLTPDGTVLRLLSGSAEDLVARSDETAAHSILALEVIAEDGSASREIVPGTDDLEPEEAVFARTSPTALDVVWWKGFELWSATLGSEGWSAPVVLHSDPREIRPHLEITTEAWEVPKEDGAVIYERGLLHLVWWDPDLPGLLYRPIAIGGEATIAPILLTESLDIGPAGPPVTGIPASLSEGFDVSLTSDGSDLVVTKVEPLAGSVEAVRISILPAELAHLGDHVQGEILDASDDFESEDAGAFAERIRTEIIGIGFRYNFQPDLVDWVSFEVGNLITDLAEASSAEELAASSGALVETLLEEVFGPEHRLATSEVVLRDLYLGDPVLDPVLRLTRVRGWNLPDELPFDDETPVAVFGTETGRHAAILWFDAETSGLHWTSAAAGDAWSEARRLQIGESLDLTTALDVVRARLR